MRPILPDRFALGRPMLLAGLRRWHRVADAGTTVAVQWREFRQSPPFPIDGDAKVYGAFCASRAGAFEYLTGVEVQALDTVPPGVGRVRVPSARYAVFLHDGAGRTLRETWEGILYGWLPGSGLRSAPSPPFERFESPYVPDEPPRDVEIWFPVE